MSNTHSAAPSQAGVRPAIEYVVSTLAYYSVDSLSPESFRLAKFDNPEACLVFWQALANLCLLKHLDFLFPLPKDCRIVLDESTAGQQSVVVSFVQHFLSVWGYPRHQFFLSSWEQSSSRELLFALAFILAQSNLFDKYEDNVERSFKLTTPLPPYPLETSSRPASLSEADKRCQQTLDKLGSFTSPTSCSTSSSSSSSSSPSSSSTSSTSSASSPSSSDFSSSLSSSHMLPQSSFLLSPPSDPNLHPSSHLLHHILSLTGKLRFTLNHLQLLQQRRAKLALKFYTAQSPLEDNPLSKPGNLACLYEAYICNSPQLLQEHVTAIRSKLEMRQQRDMRKGLEAQFWKWMSSVAELDVSSAPPPPPSPSPSASSDSVTIPASTAELQQILEAVRAMRAEFETSSHLLFQSAPALQEKWRSLSQELRENPATMAELKQTLEPLADDLKKRMPEFDEVLAKYRDAFTSKGASAVCADLCDLPDSVVNLLVAAVDLTKPSDTVDSHQPGWNIQSLPLLLQDSQSTLEAHRKAAVDCISPLTEEVSKHFSISPNT